MELSEFPFVFRLKAEQQGPNCRAEERLDVTRNNHPDHTYHRFARRLQRHRRWTVLRDRLLRRRRIGPCDRNPADIAAARETLDDAGTDIASLVPQPKLSSPAKAGDPVFQRPALVDRAAAAY